MWRNGGERGVGKELRDLCSRQRLQVDGEEHGADREAERMGSKGE